jgi:uncharacterized protein involved in exopolysaccharide biosynthesis
MMNGYDSIGDPRAEAPGNSDTFDVRNSLRNVVEAARHHKLLVALTCLSSILLVTAYLVLFPPVYTAEGMLAIERDSDPMRDAFYIGWDVFRKDDGRTEIELATSTPVLRAIVEQEHLRYDDVYHPFMSQLTYLWEESAVGREYRLLKEKLFGGKKKRGDEALQNLVRTMFDMRAGISLEPIAETNAGRITVKAPDPEIAARVANRLMDVYIERRSERHQDEARKSAEVLGSEMNDAAKELQEAERRRTVYAMSHGLLLGFQQEQAELGKLTELNESIASTQSKIAGMEASLRAIDQQLTVEPKVKTTSTVYEINALRENAKAKRLDLDISLISARDKYQENSPEVTEIKNDLAHLDAIINGTAETVPKVRTEGLNAVQQELTSKRSLLLTDLEGVRATYNVQMATAAELRRRLQSLPVMQEAMRQMDRDAALAQDKYSQLSAKHSQAEVSGATARAAAQSMRIVDRAGPPSEQTWPKPKILYPSALAVGLVLGLGMALVRSYTGGVVRQEQVEHGRGDARLYGVVKAPGRVLPLAVAPEQEDDRAESGIA